VTRPERTPYSLLVTRAFAKSLARVSKTDERRIWGAFAQMCAEGIGDIKALEGYKGVFRLRVGDIRVYFTVEGTQVVAEDLDKRGDAYRKKTRSKLKKR
jgi:mRNA interferase RelE/StbE